MKRYKAGYLAAFVLCSYCHASDIPFVVNSDGWEILGLKSAGNHITPKHETDVLGGKSVEVDVYDFGSLNKNPVHSEAIITVSTTEDPMILSYRVVTVVPDVVRAFKFNGKVFAYLVEATTYQYDGRSNTGGYGYRIRVLYQDRKGDGIFRYMSYQFPADAKVDLPSWARR